jgi:hypothetical protein
VSGTTGRARHNADCTVTIFFVAPSIEVLAVGEATCGLAWGVFMSSESVRRYKPCLTSR